MMQTVSTPLAGVRAGSPAATALARAGALARTAIVAAAATFGLAAAQEPAEESSPLPDYKEEIDHSVRWLRSTQDLGSGAYGGGVDATSHVLYALAVCPRKYRAGDGPFVAKALEFLVGRQHADGWIADPDATAERRVAQTSRAAAALSVHVDAARATALGSAVAWLARQGVDEPSLGTDGGGGAELDRGRALEASLRLLRERSPEGSWDGPEGRVIATARNVVLLTKYQKIVEPKAAKATTARPLPKFDAAKRAAVDESIRKGAKFLLAQSIGGESARWGAKGNADAGITAMVVGALQAVPEPRPKEVQAAIDDALAWLVSLQREDGSIHQGRLANYVTSAAVLALARDPAHAERVKRARDYLVRLQADEGEGYTSEHPYYGGIGYGGDERPDLSNLQMALEALAASGLDAEHEAWDRALVFLQRCQNRAESNDIAIDRGAGVTVKSGDDGGAGYAPGESKAGTIKLGDGTEVPRSYGSMSYALLKGYVFAGLSKTDPRVEMLWKWLQENYTLDVNPGFVADDDPTAPYQGLFYYFHSMAKALDLFGAETIVDGEGVSHAWRAELCGRLVAMQSLADGSWVNTNAPAWWEGNPVLATAYALLTLESARPSE